MSALTEAAGYWVAQFVGGIAGGAMLKLMTSSFGKVVDQTGGLGTDSYGKHISEGGAFVLEIVLTFLLVFVVLMVTEKQAAAGFAGTGHRLVADGDPPRRHPARRHVGEPGTRPRAGCCSREARRWARCGCSSWRRSSEGPWRRA